MLPHDSNQYLWLLLSVIFFLRDVTTFAGFNCLSNPCIHGVCIDDLNASYSCYCIDGYTGIQCQTNWDECWSNPCQNGGNCIDGIAAFNCSCPPGFIGDFCEEDFNECDSNPCLNNGTCIDIPNGYNCSCISGYFGIHCEIDVAVCNITNETRCANGGVCEEGPGVTFNCRCQPGWEGFLCEDEINECLSSPCQNGGVCIDQDADYACACLLGYTGKNCEEVILHCESNPCENGALCLTEEGRPICYCVPDFHGVRCQFQYDECQLNAQCLNGGTCIDGIDSFTCSCPPNLTGIYCECLISGTNQLDCNYIMTTSADISLHTIKPTETITNTSTEIQDFNITTSTFTQVPNISTIITETSISYSQTEMPTFLNTTYVDTTATIFYTTDETTMNDQYLSTTDILYTSTDMTTFSELELTTTEETLKPEEITPLTYTTEMFSESSTLYVTPKAEFNISTVFETTSTSLMTESQSPFPLSILQTTLTLPTSISTLLIENPTMTTSAETGQTFIYSSSLFTETTTSVMENSTGVYLDCTIITNSCQNGGTCTHTLEGYKCICQYDAEGPRCEITLGIRNAAFGGDSFLTHRLTNTSATKIEFTTKTFSPSGLIFYSSIDGTYMALYLENGYLKFIFSCGYQTMLLSELKHTVNDGFNLNIKAQLEFSKDFKRCNASVMMNNTLTMSGNQIAIFNHIIKPISILYLGGFPQEKVKDQIPSAGFMGCITDLKISNKKIDIFKEAEDGFKVSECSSLACLSNPCNNGGTCVESNDDWFCHCKNGYLGKLCESSVCDNNPCLFGASCLPFTGNGYICLCPFGKHGHFCENELETSEPYFSSSIHGYSSYAAYPIPIGGISSNMELIFKFSPTTMDQISILMFIGQSGMHDSSSDHMAVSFVKGYVLLTWNLGSGPRRIFTSRPLDTGKSSYTLRLGRFGRRAWLSVDNLGNVTGRSPGNLAQLDVVSILYLGGHHSPNFSILPHDLPLHSGFAGCIFDVELKSGNLVIPLQSSRQVVGRAVGQCETTECHEKLCQNDGACLHHGGTFTCLCQDGWFGPLCNLKHNPCDYNYNNCSFGSVCVPLLMGYECDCPIGKSGKHCENAEKLSDVSLSGKRSYLALKGVHLENSKFNIELQLRPLTDRGLILYVGHGENSFLSLTLHSGMLEFRVLPAKRRPNSGQVLSIKSNKLLAMGVWYNIRLRKYGNKLYLYVDTIVNSGLLHNGDLLGISEEIIYLGGLPDMSKLPYSASSNLPTPFSGCIRQLKINTDHIRLTSEHIISGRNVADCDGTPCGGDACENGGTCWLDSNLNPICTCPEPFVGERCEIIPTCKEKVCQNRGKCIGTRCSCILGYTGTFCESAIRIHTPEFMGNSHLVIKRSSNDKKRALYNNSLKDLHINFTTAQQYGLIFWSTKGRSFIGVGLEKGYLKITYGIKTLHNAIVEISAAKYLSDGLWHNLEIYFKGNLQIKLDHKLLHTKNKQSDIQTISTDGIYYLGGLPLNNETLFEKTYGLFPHYFVGCLKGIKFDQENIITDFSIYDGENLEVCSIS